MIIHINAKPPHFMGNKIYNKDTDLEEGKFCDNKSNMYDSYP